MLTVIYSLVVFMATFIGAATGLGGGIIIKPALDFVGSDAVSTISAYSSLAVFSMCVIAIYRRLSQQRDTQLQLSVAGGLASGSVIGGLVGEIIFRRLVMMWENHLVSLVQSLILLGVITGLVVLGFVSVRVAQVTDRRAIVVTGMLVGATSVFLGIGGGPINMAVLLYLFAMPAKEAALYSLIMIFCSQLVKVTGVMMSWNQLGMHPTVVASVLICAILGGIVGTHVQRKLQHQQVYRLYQLLMIGLWCMTAYNVIHVLVL